MTLYSGTSGWAYREWKPDFYPEGLPQRRWLEHYAQNLGACEINATFYAMRPRSTFEKWRAAAPAGFRFSVKTHRALTHAMSMNLDERRSNMLSDFVAGARGLDEGLGVILFGLPPHRERDDGALTALLAALPDDLAAAFDFNHESWDDPAVTELVAAGGATVVVSDRAGPAPSFLPPGPIAYVRLRAGRYSAPDRDRWRDLLLAEAAARDVYAFVKHEGVAADDPYGGVGLALWLHRNR